MIKILLRLLKQNFAVIREIVSSLLPCRRRISKGGSSRNQISNRKYFTRKEALVSQKTFSRKTKTMDDENSQNSEVSN